MKAIIIILSVLLLTSASIAQHNHGTQAVETARNVWLDGGLGNVDHPVTTRNAEAQKFFNQGLAYLYAFNHPEGIKSFQRAAELDPEMAMAYWGVALGLGSNYNISADEAQLTEAYTNLQKALSLAPKASQAERDYITALSKRYAADPKTDRQRLANEYKAAMGELAQKYPDDLDAATLYAESMMNLRPWQLWSLDGKPAEGTLDIIAVLEGVLKRNPNHTGANHYYIHAIEASPNPERGIASAKRLGLLAPNAGHLVHMPSHIYLRTGDYDDAAKSNDAAIVADKNYLQRSGVKGIYPMMYYNHNIHMLAASHARNGNYAGAVKAARDLETNVGPDVKAMPMLEMFMPYHLITLVRFHKWDEVMKYPQPITEMKITNAYWRMARGLAMAETGKPVDAEKELAALRQVINTIPADAGLGNSSAHGVLKVADELLAGEIALSKGDNKTAIEALRRSAAAEDLVNYNEPPDWDLPVREWLGRALLRNGDHVEAEKVYREEIVKHARSGRALFGLAESLERQGKHSSAQLVRREFERAWSGADTKLTTEQLYGSPQQKAAMPPSKVKLSTGVAMNYVETGDANGPAVILLHGYTDSSFSYSRVLPLIDRRFHIFALDHRGHGDSDRPDSGYEMKHFAADVVAFMDAKKIARATIVGHSMGSFVAIQTALDAAERVERLVLIGTATTANNAGVRELLKTVGELKDPVPASFVREFQTSTSSPSLPAEFLAKVVSESQKLPARVWKSALAGVVAIDYKPQLAKIKVPVTIFWGEKETVFFRDEQEKLKAGLPLSDLRIYPDAGHAPHWEHPERFARDLNEILSDKGGKPAGS